LIQLILADPVDAVTQAQVEALGEALLDFSELSDWVNWLEVNGLQ
jgi:hypothetical protein